jgi:sporulation protein YlmC with PRC-barrel domain
MKRTGKTIAIGALSVLCVAPWLALCAANPGTDAKANSPSDQPTQFNKASGIVGMEVRNQNNERLGNIKDVVFDLKSERVAYAVLGTGTSGKLLAVPMGALSPSSDNTMLILAADKSKLEAARGLEPNNWPSPTSLIWGAQAPGGRAANTPRISLPRK